jgi:hypothetical protein
MEPCGATSGNRSQPTATVSERLVKGDDPWLRKEIESREPEGPQDPVGNLTRGGFA